MLKRCQHLAMLGLLLGGVSTPCIADEILRDPTRPYRLVAGVAASTPRFTVNAIIVSSERKVAIVNGRRVAIGDTVDGATVLSIDKERLVLEQDDKEMTISLNKGAAR